MKKSHTQLKRLNQLFAGLKCGVTSMKRSNTQLKHVESTSPEVDEGLQL